MRWIVVMVALMALVLSSGVAFALTVDCIAGRGCVGTDGPDILNGSDGSDDMDAKQDDDKLFGNEGHDGMSGDSYAPTDTSTDGDDRVFGGPGFDGLVGYGGADLLSGGDNRDFISAEENSLNKGEDTVKGGTSNDFIFAIDQTKDTINCGGGTKDRVFYDKNIDTVERCEIQSTEPPEGEFFSAASATLRVNALRER